MRPTASDASSIVATVGCAVSARDDAGGAHEFARRFMLSAKIVQDWKQHRYEPFEPARVPLLAITRNRRAVERLLHVYDVEKATPRLKKSTHARL